MTPGPTAVPESVRDAMSRELINPDVEPEFHAIYADLVDQLERVYGIAANDRATRDIVVLGGEGILGLEAAIASLYTSFLPWRDIDDGFPYTHLTTNVVALDEALSLLLDAGLDDVYARHEAAAARCRERGAELGLDLYPDPARSSPTVTAFYVPGRAADLQRTLRKRHDVTLATGLGDLADDILRVGHMGHNARLDCVEETMDALAAVLND